MDPISPISGPIDADSFADNADAIGTKVLAEIVQNINKVNELVSGINEVDADLSTETSTRATQIGNLTTVTNANAASITNLQSDVGDHSTELDDHETRIGLLESYQSALGLLRVTGGVSLTQAQINANRLVSCGDTLTESYYEIVLPMDQADEFINTMPLTIINNGVAGGVGVTLSDLAGGTYWGSGLAASSSAARIVLAAGESVTMQPLEDGATPTSMRWHIISGSRQDGTAIGYADIVAEA